MRYFIKTFGCQMNFSDSERMATFLEQNGMQPANKIEEADLAIFNTCGVRQTAEDRVYGLVHNLRLKNKDCFIVITGCLAHRKDVARKLKNKASLFLPISEIQTLLQFLPTQKLPPAHQAQLSAAHYLCLAPQYTHTKTAFVPIMTGCNNFCAYCVVPYARGREWSRPIQDIAAEIDKLAKNGCQEITLLGQNVNSYQYRIKNEELRIKKNNNTLHNKMSLILNSKYLIPTDNPVTFPLLLDFLAQAHPTITFKFLTSHPKDFSEELVDVIAKHENIYKEIHLPVQAGSDKILKAMNRPYTQKHYLSLIKLAKKKIPSVRFTTDVIVGFPGETEDDFQQTAEVFKKVSYSEAYINKYSPRPGTAAYALKDDISWSEKKRREKTLRELVNFKPTN